jgi:hypothetical protein
VTEGASVTTAVLAGDGGTTLLAELNHELERLRVVAAVNRVVGRALGLCFDGEDGSLDIIVEDVTRRFLARTDEDPQIIDGPGGFWDKYSDPIEHAPGTDYEYRPEFCPEDGGEFDLDDYLRAVWRAHIEGLRDAERENVEDHRHAAG